ncbi:conserved exported hypothetical protein [Verrucomicrobia bacterium]|nr:conserved exported hypothetical protein [Verrucomicrobiota bacterium]
MRKTITFLLVLAGLMLSRTPTRARSGAGHMVIAAEAYRQLSPKLKTRVTEILKSHPDYGKAAESFAGDNPALDPDLFVFMRASTWADEIRRHGSPYDHPQWHYIDYPLKPPAFPVEPGPEPTNDVLFGIAQCEKAIADRKASPEDRAAYLALLIHFVGMHQPLHCCSLVTETYPTGDRGGNEFYVKPASRGISLHSLWDGLLGTSSGRVGSHLNYAIHIEAEHPRKSLPELKKAKTPKAWSLESRALAVEKAYLNGELKGGASRETAVDLPEGYTKAAKAVADRQAALARLPAGC